MMKIPALVLLFTFFSAIIARSQDIITKKNGDTINAKVLKVNPDGIEYKRYSNPDGPLYTMPTSDIAVKNIQMEQQIHFPDHKPGATQITTKAFIH